MPESDLDEIKSLLKKLLEVEIASMGFLSQIAGQHQPIAGFSIRRDSMNPIIPGSKATYQATPEPTGTTPTIPPIWTSSDDKNAPVTVDTDGLIATVNVPDTAVVPTGGLSFTLTISYANPDGHLASGSITDTIEQAPPPPPPPPTDITGFQIVRIA